MLIEAKANLNRISLHGHANYAAYCIIEYCNDCNHKGSLIRYMDSPLQLTKSQMWSVPHYSNWKKWFCPNDVKKLDSRCVKVLEVGCWEGGSALWFINNVVKYHEESELYCIDHFDSLEHSSGGSKRYLQFLYNMECTGFIGKVKVLPYFSFVGLSKLLKQGKTFDIIYIDGDHTSVGVLQDAMLAWQMLNCDGLLLFDDYEWPVKSIENPDNPVKIDSPDHPKCGIDMFLDLYSHELKIVSKGYQIIVQKVSQQRFLIPIIPQNFIPIVFIINDNSDYVRSLKVAIKSMLMKCSQSNNLIFYIIETTEESNVENRKSIEQLLHSNGINIKKQYKWIHCVKFSYLSAKLMLHDILPTNLEDVLYLDCDILFRSDVCELWNMRKRGNISAIIDSGFPQGNTGELVDVMTYFNAGVLILYLPFFRANKTFHELDNLSMLDYLNIHQDKLRYNEQDVLNIVFEKQWIQLPQSWNVQGLGTYNSTSKNDQKKSPDLVHFTGKSYIRLTSYFNPYVKEATKPWCYCCHHPYKQEWFSVLDSIDNTSWRPNKKSIVVSLTKQFKELCNQLE